MGGVVLEDGRLEPVMRAFTTYWKNKTWDGNPERGGLRHTASNEFKAHGVKAGDRVYITTIRDGQLYLGARLTVKRSLLGRRPSDFSRTATSGRPRTTSSRRATRYSTRRGRC
jgi:hypothetical protein